MTDQK